jgi:hypothetical protein
MHQQHTVVGFNELDASHAIRTGNSYPVFRYLIFNVLLPSMGEDSKAREECLLASNWCRDV